MKQMSSMYYIVVKKKALLYSFKLDQTTCTVNNTVVQTLYNPYLKNIGNNIT